MSRITGHSPPPALTPIASTSTAHLGNAGHSGVRHRHDKEPATCPPTTQTHLPAKTQRRKRRDGARRGRRLRWRKGVVAEAFRKFGEHCARNQIRTLLIDCLVMTNLFYPSLALYLQKRFPPLYPPSPPAHNIHRLPFNEQGHSSQRTEREHPLSLLSTPVLDSFFPYPPPLLPRLLLTGWWGRDSGQYEPEGWGLSRALPEGSEGLWGGEEEIRVMRIGWADVEDVLDRGAESGERAWEERDHILLKMVRDMAEEWEVQNPSTGEGCIRQLRSADGTPAEPIGPCYIISPNDDLSRSDVPVVSIQDLTPASSNSNTTLQSGTFPDSTPNTGNIYHSVAALFRVPHNSTTAFSARWQKGMAEIARRVEGEVFAEVQGHRAGGGDQTGQWYLSYTSSILSDGPEHSDRSEAHMPNHPETLSSTPPKIVLFLYAILFSTLGAQLSNASKVHSRFGLAFTGVVQLCCSAVMSFSVLALLGWNGWGSSSSPSSLPTYVLPFVIVVVGAENMSTLTQAIFSIPFSHSVPVRIGLGLSKVGTTIALTSLTDLLLLGVVWLCVNLRPVREFCLFAAVVIITDWFMLHTFFLTVLSIDAQRLELADVLASNGVAPISPVQPNSSAEDQADGRQGGFSWRNVLRARTTKSGSLVLLLITVGLLYWLTERHRIPLKTTASLYGYTPNSRAGSTSPAAFSPTRYTTTANDVSRLSPSELLWRSLNPAGWPYARIFVPAASILVLPKLGHSMRPVDIRKLSLPASRLLLPRLRPLFYLFKVVILPQAVTAGALYSLLLYLLKDADLLDAQRDRLGRVDESQGNETDSSPGTSKNGNAHLASGIKAHMLPCSHESDVDIISSSSDGLMALSVGIDNTVCLWRFTDNGPGSGTREPLQTPALDPEDPIVAAIVSEDRRYVGVCSTRGVVQVWEIWDEGPVTPLAANQVTEASTTRITGMAFDDVRVPGLTEDPFTATPNKSSGNTDSVVAPTVLVAFADGSVISLKDSLTPALVIPPRHSNTCSCRTSFLRFDGVLNVSIATPDSVDVYHNTTSGWLPTQTLSTLPEDRITAVSPPTVVLPGHYALGHRSGTIELVDEMIGHLVTIAPSIVHDSIRQVELARPTSMRCTGCGTTSSDGYLVVSSTLSHVYIDRIAPRAPTSVFCRCAARRGSSIDEPTASASSSLRKSPSRSSLGDALVVPPSSARRKYSPGTSPRKSPSLLPPVSNGEFPLSSHGGPRRLSNLHRPDDDHTSSSPIDRSSTSMSGSTASPAGEMELSPLGAISSVGGGWVIQGDILIGVRRINEGIDDTQWSVYAIDLAAPFNGATLVVDTIELDQLLLKTQTWTDPSNNTSGSQFRSAKSVSTGMSISMRERRTERIHSMNGRASFPERPGVGSFSVPTFEGLGYVEVRELAKLGTAVIGAFGNKLGILDLSGLVSGTGSGAKGNGGPKVGGGIALSTGIGVGTPTPRRQGVFPLAPPPSSVKRDALGLAVSGSGRKVD